MLNLICEKQFPGPCLRWFAGLSRNRLLSVLACVLLLWNKSMTGPRWRPHSLRSASQCWHPPTNSSVTIDQSPIDDVSHVCFLTFRVTAAGHAPAHLWLVLNVFIDIKIQTHDGWGSFGPEGPLPLRCGRDPDGRQTGSQHIMKPEEKTGQFLWPFFYYQTQKLQMVPTWFIALIKQLTVFLCLTCVYWLQRPGYLHTSLSMMPNTCITSHFGLMHNGTLTQWSWRVEQRLQCNGPMTWSENMTYLFLLGSTDISMDHSVGPSRMRHFVAEKLLRSNETTTPHEEMYAP